MKAKYIDKTFPITLQDLIDLAKSENKDPRDLKLIMNSNQADLASYVQCALLNPDQGDISIELYIDADDGLHEDITLKTKPKSPMKQGRIHQAQILVAQIIEEIQDLSSDQGIVLASDTDLQNLTEAFDIISSFNSKQGH